MTPRRYSWLLFDADGTLFDYDRAEAKALENTFRQYGLPFDAQVAALYQKINSELWTDFENGAITAAKLRLERFSRLFASIQAEASPEDFSRRYLEELSQAADLQEGARETIRALHACYRLGVITNGLSEVQRPRMAASGIADCFSLLAISEEIGVVKPDPRFFDAVLQQIGSPPKTEVLVIGDSLKADIQGGNNAGLDTCWHNPAGAAADPRYPATYEVRRLKDLLQLLAC